MKIIFTKHALKKQEILRELGWSISLNLVQEAIRRPEFTGETKYKQTTAIKILDKNDDDDK